LEAELGSLPHEAFAASTSIAPNPRCIKDQQIYQLLSFVMRVAQAAVLEAALSMMNERQRFAPEDHGVSIVAPSESFDT
jgi:hypothetical protein